MNNHTFTVASLFECNRTDMGAKISDPQWRQTAIGCRVLLLLQEMFHFGLIYNISGNSVNLSEAERRQAVYPRLGNHIDIYARPMAFTDEALEAATPIIDVFTWRFGFMMRRADFGVFNSFYSEPFSTNVWICIFFLIITVSILLFTVKSWEQRVLEEQDCSFFHELFVSLSACCQHYLTVNPRLGSVRTTYSTFYLFAYVMYSIYTSNLLSHLVSDRKNTLGLNGLADSSYNCIVLENMTLAIEGKMPSHAKHLADKKLRNIQKTNISAGLEAVKKGNTALLSDFVVLYPVIKATFDEVVICQLLEVNLHKNIRKHFFVSKNFLYKEQFKIGTLRAQETGILQHLIAIDNPSPPACVTKPQIVAHIEHIYVPLTILGSTYVLALFLLLLERLRHDRKLHTYIE